MTTMTVRPPSGTRPGFLPHPGAHIGVAAALATVVTLPAAGPSTGGRL